MHNWIAYYDTAIVICPILVEEIHEESFSDLKLNPFICLESLAPENLKPVKEEWIAKELRKRHDQFATFSTLKVFTGSWNINGQVITKPIDAWINCPDADLVVLGFQELDLTTEAYLLTDTSKEDALCATIEATFREQGAQFIRVLSKKLIGIFIVAYVKRKHFSSVCNVACEYVTTGIMGIMVRYILLRETKVQ